MIVKKIKWETIKFQWQHNLWPGRYDVKPMSSMVYNNPDGYSMDIYNNYKPTFWGVYTDDNQIVGVNSGFRTEDTLYRSRGIWVASNFRKQGIAQLLFKALEEQAREEGCDRIWSYPRKGSHYAYLKFGFEIVSDWYRDTFGQNVYVLKKI
jgi:GNAT superfamily N-acetyltransferase